MPKVPNGEKFVPGHETTQGAEKQVALSPEVHQKLLELQRKGIDVNELLIEFLEKRELELAQEKEKLSAEY